MKMMKLGRRMVSLRCSAPEAYQRQCLPLLRIQERVQCQPEIPHIHEHTHQRHEHTHATVATPSIDSNRPFTNPEPFSISTSSTSSAPFSLSTPSTNSAPFSISTPSTSSAVPEALRAAGTCADVLGWHTSRHQLDQALRLFGRGSRGRGFSTESRGSVPGEEAMKGGGKEEQSKQIGESEAGRGAEEEIEGAEERSEGVEGRREGVSGSSRRAGRSGSAVVLEEVVVVGVARTAVGSFQGSLSSFSATQLGAAAIAGALARAGVPGSAVQEVLMGNVLSAGLGQAPTKLAALAAGVSESAVCTTVNKVCSSGLKAVMMGAQSIALGCHEVVVAGGMESMSNAPFLLPRSARLKRPGDLPLLDSVIFDGLRDPLRGYSMGVLAQHCADDLRISRDDQDESAIESYKRALEAEATGKFLHEIVTPVPPVTLPTLEGDEKASRKGGHHHHHPHSPLMFDEELKRFDPDKMRQLEPAFTPDGSITAGNASSLADGAAALVLTSASYAAKHNLPVMAYLKGWADAEQDAERFPTSPSLAIPLALKMAGLQLQDADLFEVNEAFAAVTLANSSLLGLQSEHVNVHGGAVALGHPIGASGARILVSLLTSLGVGKEDIGVAAVCNGGGGASALVVQREPSFSIRDHH